MAMDERNAAALTALSPGGSCHKIKVAILWHQYSRSAAKQQMLNVMLPGRFALHAHQQHFHSHMCSRVRQGTIMWRHNMIFDQVRHLVLA